MLSRLLDQWEMPLDHGVRVGRLLTRRLALALSPMVVALVVVIVAKLIG